MPRYYSLGKIPPKRHTVFENPTGGIYQEELFGTAGFAGMSSLLYHINPPTVVSEIKKLKSVAPKIAIEKNMKALSFKGFSLKPEKDYLNSRKTLFVFVHIGSGTLKTMYGNIDFKYGDYLIIPRGTIYQIDFDTENNRILYIE